MVVLKTNVRFCTHFIQQIFVDKKQIKLKFHSALQTWFFNSEAFNKAEQANSTELIEPSFVNKLVEMFKYRRILCDLKQEIEHKDGLSQGYVRTEGKHIVDTMLKFRSSTLQKIFAPRIKDLDAQFQ